MAEKFVGSWKRVKIENNEDYLRMVACDEETIKAALIADKEESTLEVTLDGKKFTWNQENAGKKWPGGFPLDEVREGNTPHGSYKSVTKMEGEKMITTHIPNNTKEKTITSVKWIEGDRIVEVATAGGVTCNIEFVRV